MGVGSGSLGLLVFAYLKYRTIDISLQRFTRVASQSSFLQQDRATALLLPFADIAIAHFACLLSMYYLPALLWATVGLNAASVPTMWTGMIGLLFLSALMFRGPLASVASVVVAPIAAGIAVGQWMPSMFTYGNLPLVYAITSSLMSIGMFWKTGVLSKGVARWCSLWLYGLVTLGFFYLTPMTILSSLISLATAVWLAKSY